MKKAFNRALVGTNVAVVLGADKAERLANYVELYFSKSLADDIRADLHKFDGTNYAVSLATGKFGKKSIYVKRDFDIISWNDCLVETRKDADFDFDLLGTNTAVICTADKAVLLAGRLLADGIATEEDFADLIANKGKFDGTNYAVNLSNGKYGKKEVYLKKSNFAVVKYNDTLIDNDVVENFEIEVDGDIKDVDFVIVDGTVRLQVTYTR